MTTTRLVLHNALLPATLVSVEPVLDPPARSQTLDTAATSGRMHELAARLPMRLASLRMAMSLPSVATLPGVLSRRRERLHRQDSRSSGYGSWSYRSGSQGKSSRYGIIDVKSTFSTLPRNYNPPAVDQSETDSVDELSPYMSLTYAKLLKLKKQKEELQRLYHMLDDLENDFLGAKDNSGYIERYMEVKVKKDYMLSPGNPESTIEQEDTIKVYGYLGHNVWRAVGPYCKGYCRRTAMVNPKIRSQNQIVDLNIMCNSCNKITVPLIGAVPTSILQIRSTNPD